MTSPRTAMFAHLNGPCDGTDMPVQVDDDGVPVEYNMVPSMTNPDRSIPPALGIQSRPMVSLYERDIQIGDDGEVRYVFHYRGTDVLGANPPMAA